MKNVTSSDVQNSSVACKGLQVISATDESEVCAFLFMFHVLLQAGYFVTQSEVSLCHVM